jgi:glycosyltransferase involved in cell wall biosynthesis
VYLGVAACFRQHSAGEIAAARDKLGLPPRYVLCVGSLEPRKNLARLLAAWQQIQHKLRGLSLVLAGAKSRIFRDAGVSLPTAVHATGYLPEELLPAVYAGAEMFVYPSLYEGFGLPVLEAMASGVPVVTSNVASLPEVAGDAALTIDPQNIDSIAGGIENLASDSVLRTNLREKGLARAQLFTWQQAADQTWRVLEAAA